MTNNDAYKKAWSDWLAFRNSFKSNKHLTFNDFKKKYDGINHEVIYTVHFGSLEIGVSGLFNTTGSLISDDKEYYVSCHLIIRIDTHFHFTPSPKFYDIVREFTGVIHFRRCKIILLNLWIHLIKSVLFQFVKILKTHSPCSTFASIKVID